MHEFSIIQNMFSALEKVAQDNCLRCVNIVVLQIGKLRQVVPEFIQFAFNTIAKDTIFSKAKLIIEEIPITMQCNQCQRQFVVADKTYICPDCKSGNLSTLTGKEIILSSIEGEK